MRKTLVQELVNRGYNVESVDVVKNGVTLEGIRFDNGTNVQPTIYTERYESWDVDDAVDDIIRLFESAESNQPRIPVDSLHDKDFVLKGLHVGFQRPSEENIVKRPSEFGDIEEHLYVVGGRDDGGQWSYKVSANLLKAAEITDEEAWHTAYKNMANETVIKSMFDTMCEMMGDMMGVGELPPLPEGPQMYVLSNKSRVKGAASWVDKDSIKALARKVGTTKLFVLPSSIHEMIIVPVTDDMDTDIETLNEMVRNVNETQVDPVEQLGDHAYCVEI